MKRATLLLVLLLAAPCAAMAAGADFTVTPGNIDIHAFYNGTSVTVEGTAPEGSQVVLRFTGAPEDLRMKEKGKALGLLWMNMNTLHFANVPKVCLIESSAPLADMGKAGAGLGLEGLAGKIGIEPVTADRTTLLPELLKLKKQEGLYRQTSGAVVMGEKSGDMRKFSAKLAIPSRLSPGAYVVEVFTVKDGEIATQAVKAIDVKLVGAPALLADLAFNHSAWYGILASLIAILAGLGIGLVFQSKEPH